MLGKILSVFGGSGTNSDMKSTLSSLKLVGELFIKEIGSPKKKMYEECELSMSIVNEKTFDYNLICKNSEDENDCVTFPITNECGFKTCVEQGREILFWEHNQTFYLFVILLDEENEKVKKAFYNALCDVVASYEYTADLAAAMKMTEGKEDYLMNYDQVDNLEKLLDKNYGAMYGKQEEKMIKEKLIQTNVDDLTKNMSKIKIGGNFKENFPNADCIYTARGQLYKYDQDSDMLLSLCVEGIFKLMEVNPFAYYIVVDSKNEDKTYTYTQISQDTNILTNSAEHIVMWLSMDSANNANAYNFAFSQDDSLQNLRKVLAKCKYESSSNSRYEDLKDDEREWIENENIPDDAMDVDDNVEMEFDTKYQESTSEKVNKATAQAYLHDRTFVVHNDNTIGVYKTDEDEVLSHLVNLPAVTEYNNKKLDIKNAQMFQSDTGMIFLDSINPNTAYKYDLGKGKVVEEWTAEDVKSISAVAPEQKLGQMTDSQILLGVNSQNLFMMDGRVNKKNKVVNVKNYKTNPKMNTLVTTDFGGIATASTNGEIRLYNQVGKNAKTLLPCFGDPIKAIDVTIDGKFILATCDKYLIFIPTACKGDKNGFTAQMGKEKPHPKTLKIKPIDIKKYGLDNLSFTPAKFNINKIEGETNVITSIGDYVVIWNFSKIKKGILDDYKIKKVNQHVIENQFKFNKNQVVVTMENKLRIQNQKKLFNEEK